MRRFVTILAVLVSSAQATRPPHIFDFSCLSTPAKSYPQKKFFKFCSGLIHLIAKPKYLAGERILSSQPYPFRFGQGRGAQNFGFVKLKTQKGNFALKLCFATTEPEELTFQNEMAIKGLAPSATLVSASELKRIRALLSKRAKYALDDGRLTHGILMDDLGETWSPVFDYFGPAWVSAWDKEDIKRQVSLIAEEVRQNGMHVFDFQVVVTPQGKVFMVDFAKIRKAKSDEEIREPLNKEEHDLLHAIDTRHVPPPEAKNNAVPY